MEQLYLISTEKFTAETTNSYNEFMVQPLFYVKCNSDFANKYDAEYIVQINFGYTKFRKTK